MLQQLLLLVFIAISSVYCQVCPRWTALPNNAALTNDFDGTFYKYFASGVNTSNVEDCQRHDYISEDGHIVNGYLQSAAWCNQLTNCTETLDYHECDLIFLSASPQPPKQRTKIKIVAKMAIPLTSDYCLVTSYCRNSEEGIGVLCTDEPPNLVLFLAQVINLLISLIGLDLPPILINHSNCEFENSCPP